MPSLSTHYSYCQRKLYRVDLIVALLTYSATEADYKCSSLRATCLRTIECLIFKTMTKNILILGQAIRRFYFVKSKTALIFRDMKAFFRPFASQLWHTIIALIVWALKAQECRSKGRSVLLFSFIHKQFT